MPWWGAKKLSQSEKDRQNTKQVHEEIQKWNILLQLPRPLPLSHLRPQSFHKLLRLKNSLGNERSWWRSQRQTSNDVLVRVDFKLAKNISWTPSIVARYISRHRGSSPSSPQKAPHHPQAERLLWVELWKWSQFLAFERSTALESRTPGSGPEAWGLGLSPPCGRDTENNHKSSSHLSEQVGMQRWQYIVDQ